MLLCSALPVDVSVLPEQGGSMLKRELMARNDVAPARFISRTVRLARRRTPLLPQSRAQRTRAACDQLSGSFRVVRRAGRDRVAQRNQCGCCAPRRVAQDGTRDVRLLRKAQPADFQTAAVRGDLR